MMKDERRIAYVAAHPRGFYWVRDEKHVRALRSDEQLSDPFVAFFTGDDDPPVVHWGVTPMQSVWSYPGDDPRHGLGRPFDHPTVIEKVPDPVESDAVRRLDAVILKMWSSSHLIAPGREWPPSRPVSMTMLSAYGRQVVCPGDPDDVVAFLRTTGFEATLRLEKDSSSWSVLVGSSAR